MKNTTQQNSLIKINSDVEFIKQEIGNFSPDSYQSIKEIIEEFSANIEFLFIERIQLTEDKYKERIERYKEINKKTKEYNKNLPRQTLIEYLRSNPEEFIDKKLSRIGHFKNRDLFLKSKSANIKDFIPE